MIFSFEQRNRHKEKMICEDHINPRHPRSIVFEQGNKQEQIATNRTQSRQVGNADGYEKVRF